MATLTAVQSLSARYESLAREWAAIPLSRYRTANRVFRDMHEIAMHLKSTVEGRAELEKLSQNSERSVRAAAATECLSWHSEAAVDALREIAKGGDLQAGSARETLRAYDAGSLDVDW